MQYENLSDKRMNQYIHATMLAFVVFFEYACIFSCAEPFLARRARAMLCDHYVFPLAVFAGVFLGWGSDMLAINASEDEDISFGGSYMGSMFGAGIGAGIGILYMQARVTCGAKFPVTEEEPMIQLALDTEAQAPRISSSNQPPAAIIPAYTATVNTGPNNSEAQTTSATNGSVGFIPIAQQTQLSRAAP